MSESEKTAFLQLHSMTVMSFGFTSQNCGTTAARARNDGVGGLRG